MLILRGNLKIFLDIFPKFDVKYCNFYKRKKKRGVIKIKKNKKNVKRLNINKKNEFCKFSAF
jgi:hypothetical protein